MSTPKQAFRRATGNLMCLQSKRTKQAVQLLDSAGHKTWHLCKTASCLGQRPGKGLLPWKRIPMGLVYVTCQIT